MGAGLALPGPALKLATSLGQPPEPPAWLLLTVLQWVDVALALNIALLLAATFASRVARTRRIAREAAFQARWEPVLFARMAGEREPLPFLGPFEGVMFLVLWLKMLTYVREEAHEALLDCARELGMADFALHLLDNPLAWKRLVGKLAIERLRVAKARGKLIAAAKRPRPRGALAAARALLAIDRRAGLDAVEGVLTRFDWSPGPMAEMLKPAGAAAVERVGGMIAAAPPGRATALVRLAERLESGDILPVLRARLGQEDAGETAAILHALGRLGGAEDRITARACLGHESWLVRMQAAAALGRIGLAEDYMLLVPRLADPEWWVRYRAAGAIVKLVGAEGLARLAAGQPAGPAQEMIRHVLAEAR